MINNKITCDICKKEIGQISAEEMENHLIGDGVIVASNYPNYISMKMLGHGKLGAIDRTYDICDDCLTNFTIHVNRENYFRMLVLKRVKIEEEQR